MANKIQIRRGSFQNFKTQLVCQGELLWVTDIQKLYIGINGTPTEPVVVGDNLQNVKVISPDASEVTYDNTLAPVEDRLSATTVQNAIDELATEKQNKLGGSGEDGKAIIASNTLGTVTYRDIDDAISSSSDGSDHLVTANAVYDNFHTLDLLKQDKPTNVTSGNIAVFDNNRNTIDSEKTWTTEINGSSTDNQVPTALAVNTFVNDMLTSAVNYKGACIESELPKDDQKVGDYWTVLDFDESYPDMHRDGRAIWNGDDWDKVVDDFYGPDNEYIELTSGLNGNDGSSTSPKLTLKNKTRTDSTDTQTATFSGTVDVISSINTTPKGQVTGVTIKTVTMPSLGKSSTTAAQGDLAEYIENKINSIRDINNADNTKYPTERAVRVELDKKANKSNISGSGSTSNDYSLVQYNEEGIITAGTKVIDGGTF